MYFAQSFGGNPHAQRAEADGGYRSGENIATFVFTFLTWETGKPGLRCRVQFVEKMSEAGDQKAIWLVEGPWRYLYLWTRAETEDLHKAGVAFVP
jgi:hypothetical protein